MKFFFTLLVVGLTGIILSGCYVPMPSVGIRPTRVHHTEVCTHIAGSNALQCTHTRRYVK